MLNHVYMQIYIYLEMIFKIAALACLPKDCTNIILKCEQEIHEIAVFGNLNPGNGTKCLYPHYGTKFCQFLIYFLN